MRVGPLVLVALAGAPAAAEAPRLSYADLVLAAPAPAPRLEYVELVRSEAAEAAEATERVRDFYGDRFEWRPEGDSFHWDVSAEIGGPRHRLWLASAGDGTRSGLDYLELQALYSRPFTASGLAVQAGLRQDLTPRPRRSYAVLGVQGNLTDPLYVGAFAFLSHRGELSGRVFAYYDLALTDRLVLQPAVEAEVAAADAPALGIGAGPVYVEAGLRLRYRLAEPFAPYVGLNWERLLGRTARLARAAGDDLDSAAIVLGFRSYF